MRIHLVISSLPILLLASGCFGPDPGAPAPNYNPAAERDDYPEPAGSESRAPESSSNDPAAKSGSERRDFSQGSGRIVKDFADLKVEKIREAFEPSEGSDDKSEASETVAPSQSVEQSGAESPPPDEAISPRVPD